MKRTIVLPSGLAVTSLDDLLGHHSLANPDGARMDLTTVPDPRWGTQFSVPSHGSISMPGGLVATSDTVHTVGLRNPNDPLSLVSETLASTSSGRQSTSVYDAASRITTYTSAAGRVSTTAFDPFGRVISRHVAGRAEVSASYNSAGRLTKLSMGTGDATRTVSFDYGVDGRLSGVTDPVGQRASFLHDADGRIVGQTMPDGKALAFIYDLDGNLASLTPPGRPAHSFSYSAENRLQRYVPPSVSSTAAGTVYAYDQDARLAKITRADGGTAELTYDAGGRLARLQVASGTVTYTRDSTTGNLAGIAGPGTVSIAYAYAGPLLTAVQWAGPISGKVGRSYDQDFRIVSLQVNSMPPVEFRYDPDGLPVKAGDLELLRDGQSGLPVATTLGQLQDHATYDSFGAVSGYDVAHSSTPLLSGKYGYDRSGRLTTRMETVLGETLTFTYSYDAAGRLSAVRRNGATVETYGYDDNGNRTSAPGLSAVPTYDVQDRLIRYGDNAYTYTSAGDLATDRRNHACSMPRLVRSPLPDSIFG